MKRNVSVSFHRKTPSRRPDPDCLAVEILTFLAADEDRLGRFLGVTGLDVDDVRQVTRGAGFAESMLDYLSGDEALLVAFAADRKYEPAAIEAARLSLTRHFDEGG